MGVTASVIGAVAGVAGAAKAITAKDPAKAAARAQDKAAQAASIKDAMRRKALADNSLATGGGQAGAAGATTLGV